MKSIKLGINLWSQGSDWPTLLAAAKRADQLGFEHVWMWDHLYAIFGDPNQEYLRGLHGPRRDSPGDQASSTRALRRGEHIPKSRADGEMVTTIDHISGGRAIMGLGGAWFEAEHRAYGLEFGAGFGERLDWLAEAVTAARILFDGGEVSSPEDGRYAFDHLRISPLPLQQHLPIMIGGGGERKTLRIVAEHADMWNVFGTPEILAHKDEVLRAHCTDVGRDPSEIERTVGCKMTIRQSEAEAERVRLALLERNRTPLSRVKDDLTFWTGTPEQIAETMISYRNIGFHTFIAELPAPYDVETMETLVNVVKPMARRPSRSEPSRPPS